MKDSIHGIRAEIMAINQRNQRDNVSGKRVSIQNVAESKESAK